MLSVLNKIKLKVKFKINTFRVKKSSYNLMIKWLVYLKEVASKFASKMCLKLS